MVGSPFFSNSRIDQRLLHEVAWAQEAGNSVVLAGETIEVGLHGINQRGCTALLVAFPSQAAPVCAVLAKLAGFALAQTEIGRANELQIVYSHHHRYAAP